MVIYDLTDYASYHPQAINHSVKYVALFCDPIKPRIPGERIREIERFVDVMSFILEWESLRTIDLILISQEDFLIGSNYTPTVIEELFGSATAVMVDLKDKKEYSRVIDLLLQDHVSHYHRDLLAMAHYSLNHNDHDQLYSWTEIVRKLQCAWVEGMYNDAWTGDAEGVPSVNATGETVWDLEHPWSKRVLARMPELRPIFGLGRQDSTWKPTRPYRLNSILNEMK